MYKHKLKQVIRILFKQEFYRDSLHVCQQHSSFYILHKYGCSSWWWTWEGLKQVEVINKIDEIH